jgi:hypothetical protein
MMDRQVVRDRKDKLKEIDEYRKKNQQPHQRRDFDLNDPQKLKKGKPARVGDYDPNCGPSTAQQFEGEDLAQKKRIGLQQEQMRVWTNGIGKLI